MIIACLDGRFAGRTFDISGLEQITYIDIIRQIKEVVGSRTAIVRIPFRMFWWLLRTYAVFDNGSAVHHPPARGAGHSGVVPGHRLARHFRMHADPLPDGDRADLPGPDVLAGRSRVLSRRRKEQP